MILHVAYTGHEIPYPLNLFPPFTCSSPSSSSLCMSLAVIHKVEIGTSPLYRCLPTPFCPPPDSRFYGPFLSIFSVTPFVATITPETVGPLANLPSPVTLFMKFRASLSPPQQQQEKAFSLNTCFFSSWLGFIYSRSTLRIPFCPLPRLLERGHLDVNPKDTSRSFAVLVSRGFLFPPYLT